MLSLMVFEYEAFANSYRRRLKTMAEGTQEQGTPGTDAGPKITDRDGLAAAAQAMGAAEKLAMLGHVVVLMMQSPAHKSLFLSDLEWCALPALKLGQFRVWHKGPLPIGYASWAYLTEEAESRLINEGVMKVRPTDWGAGDRLWLMDVICPHGGADKATAELRDTVFKDKKVKTLQPAPDGKGMAVVEW